MSAAKPREFDGTPEAVVRTNWRVLGSVMAISFVGGGWWWEQRAMRVELDRNTAQILQLQTDIRELTILVRGRDPIRGSAKVSQNERELIP